MPQLRIVTGPEEADSVFRLSEESTQKLCDWGMIYQCGDPDHGHPDDYHLDPEFDSFDKVEDLLIFIFRDRRPPVTLETSFEIRIDELERMSNDVAEQFMEAKVHAAVSDVAVSASKFTTLSAEAIPEEGLSRFTVSLDIIVDPDR